MTVETTEELPNLVGNHCAETPFQYYPGLTTIRVVSVPGRPRLRAGRFKRNATHVVERLSDWNRMN